MKIFAKILSWLKVMPSFKRTVEVEKSSELQEGGYDAASGRQAKALMYVERKRLILTDYIFEYFADKHRIHILDGGARDALEDLRWKPHDTKNLKFIGFEPDPAEYKTLTNEIRERKIDFTVFPFGLWSHKSEKTLYETESGGASSLFVPNKRLVDRWKMQNSQTILLGEKATQVKKIYTVPCESLDRLWVKKKIKRVDFLKLNIQGSEKKVLEGAKRVLKNCLGIQIEVSFVESYIKRPFFSDVDPLLRSLGFHFYDIVGHHYLGRKDSKITARHLPGLNGLYGQFIEGHAVYFRDPIDKFPKSEKWTLKSILTLVSLLETCHQIEAAFELLKWSENYFEGKGMGSEASTIQKIRKNGEQDYLEFMGPSTATVIGGGT
jgi:FkbM family methyltransferase